MVYFEKVRMNFVLAFLPEEGTEVLNMKQYRRTGKHYAK